MDAATPPMHQALAAAEAAALRGEVPVGAVVIESEGGRVLAGRGKRGEAPSGPTLHPPQASWGREHKNAFLLPPSTSSAGEGGVGAHGGAIAHAERLSFISRSKC